VFYYPDREGEAEFTYRIDHDSLTIYFDGSTSGSIIKKVTKDSLVLITGSDLQTYVKRTQ
jgi:hypothetical protein